MHLNSLTPALSHPMGEGESFAGFLECRASRFAGWSFAKKVTANAVPSPRGWESVRVRAKFICILALKIS
jgi:hypothetical protein